MNDMITIPRVRYDALMVAEEDLLDIQAYDAAMAALARGDEERVPSEFVERMLDGESIVKLWREHRGHNQTGLSKLSGVNRVQIADIEAGRKTGSAETLKKLADALGVTIDDLID